MSPDVPARFTYAEQLAGRGYGLPLWYPEPTQYSGVPCEVEIGDVGYVSEGCFKRLFNVMRPKSDPLNVHGVPNGFVILEPNEEDFYSEPRHIPPGPICTPATVFNRADAGTSDTT